MKKIMTCSIILTGLGVLMVYSASMIWASYKLNDPNYYLVRQGIFAIIGLAIMFLVSYVDIEIIKKWVLPLFFTFITLLVIVLIPGIGVVRGGARSWIGFGVFQIQPSEFMKLGMIMFVAKYISKNSLDKCSNLIPLTLVVCIVFFLIMLEPDLGTGVVIMASTVGLFFAGGIRIRYLVMLAFLGIVGSIGLIMVAPYRIDRITAFLDPWSDPLGTGFQTIQSLYALSPGGFFGLGLFNSRQKFFYLPEPQTDFIFSIIAEELGFIGIMVVFSLFFIIFYYGIITSLKAQDKFSSYLSFGITISLFIQFFINIGVVIGLLPVTGITLPFLSYGGSSLIITLVMIGIILSIARKYKVS